jgi:hypothetical protein
MWVISMKMLNRSPLQYTQDKLENSLGNGQIVYTFWVE